MVKAKKDQEFVKLHVTGSHEIVRSPFYALARLNATWYGFLAGCGIKLSLEDNVLVRTRNASTRVSAGGKDRVFTAELHEPICDFIGKFERKKASHTIWLMFKNGRSSKTLMASNVQSQNDQSLLTPAQRTRRGKGGKGYGKLAGAPSIVMGTGPSAVGVGTSSDANKPQYTPAFKRGATEYGARLRSRNGQGSASTSRNQCIAAVQGGLQNSEGEGNRNTRRGMKRPRDEPSTPRIECVRSLVKIEPESQRLQSGESSNPPVEYDGENGAEFFNENDEDDGWAHVDDDMYTAASMEQEELRQEGIEVEDVKSLAYHGLQQFSNPFILKVRNEIRKLKKNNLWERNVKRSPLSCYLLQELLKT